MSGNGKDKGSQALDHQRKLPRSPSSGALSRRTLGPIPDLERHLPADWWRTLFNSVYLKTDGDVVENDTNTTREVDLLVRVAGLEPNDRILDLCCGQGRHCLELARRGFRKATGVDRSRYLIRLARRRAKQQQLSISFHEGDEGDARKFRLKEDDFHCVAMLGNSFGYFDQEEDDLAVLRSVIRSLGPGGGVIALDIANGEWMRQNFVPRSWEWIDPNQFVCRQRSLSADARRLISREVVVHAERGVIVDQFYAERLYAHESIVALLEQAGFTSIREHDLLEVDSDRNQDLGMMANRMFLTAKSPRVPSRSSKRQMPYPEVTVILGDPRLPDSCKRDGQFNSEDFDTIERLTGALGKLNEYTFTYLDNHGSLLADLRVTRPSFVFNLCDEGFDNDAFKELHVPAMLEMLGVPYSGAGPAPLGLCYNKSHVRSIADSLAVPVPLETYIDPDDQSGTLPSVWPALIKPTYGDSSVGITQESVVDTPEALLARMEEMRTEFPGMPLLIQEFLTGNEYSVGIVGNPGLGFQFLPPLEVDYSGLRPELPRILGYESKWLPNSPYWSQIKYHVALLDEEMARRLYDYSSPLFERLGCRDYARFDFRADAEGTVKLLEVNPNPGWCWDGRFNFMAGYAGLRYADLLRLILEAAPIALRTKRKWRGESLTRRVSHNVYDKCRTKFHYSFLKIFSGSDLSRRRLPYMQAESSRRGPCVWLTACSHGDEVGGLVVVQEVFKRLRKLPLLKGSLRAFPLMNPLGFEVATRHVTFSEEDLNRSFPGNPTGTLAERVAKVFNAFGRLQETLLALSDGVVLGISDSSVAFPGAPLMAFGLLEPA